MKNGVECPIDPKCLGIKPDGTCDGRCSEEIKAQAEPARITVKYTIKESDLNGLKTINNYR